MLLSLSCSFTALSAWPKHPAVSPYEISIHCMCGWGWVVVSLSRGHGGVILNVSVHTHHVAAESPLFYRPIHLSLRRRPVSQSDARPGRKDLSPLHYLLLTRLWCHSCSHCFSTAWVCIVSGGALVLNIITARWCSPLSLGPMTSSQEWRYSLWQHSLLCDKTYWSKFYTTISRFSFNLTFYLLKEGS